MGSAGVAAWYSAFGSISTRRARAGDRRGPPAFATARTSGAPTEARDCVSRPMAE